MTIKRFFRDCYVIVPTWGKNYTFQCKCKLKISGCLHADFEAKFCRLVMSIHRWLIEDNAKILLVSHYMIS
ncbi:CLUMA_CG006388, isoform A [Clunio marinus]|uniref:CLUMA_CG006388, isoform A n=1 Tax=Clunio marinus TaxID=568069 RepID=A0A1J1HXP6_9DIPT|nr:CLUMA_CG006388, isoform A [Clunio marinus]